MTAKPTPQQIDQLVQHVASTLPDSMLARKALLSVLYHVLPRANVESRTSVRIMIESLALHEQEQLKLVGILPEDPK